jgi:uncharacterized protein (TIGR00369 family)
MNIWSLVMQQTVESIQSLLLELCPLYRHIRLSVESAGNGVYRCRIPLNEQNGNHIGSMHAALQWAAAEMLGGIVMIAKFDISQLFLVVKSLNIHFLKPARTGISAEAKVSDTEVEKIRQKLENCGEASFNIKAIVSDDSRVVAETEAEYLVRKLR